MRSTAWLRWADVDRPPPGVLRRVLAARAAADHHPALVLRLDGEIDTVVALRIDDGLITGLYAVRKPEKLSHTRRRRR